MQRKALSPIQSSIIIERRERIAVIAESEFGSDRPILVAAMEHAANYVADHEPYDETVSLEFEYLGNRYYIGREHILS